MFNNKQMKTTLYVFSVFLASAFPVAAAGSVDHSGIWSILPPLLAIGLALLLRQVIPALFVGLWFGAWIVVGLDLDGLWSSLLASFDTYIVGALADPDQASIVLFSMMIGGMVGIISANGGMLGVVARISRIAHNARRTALATWAMGMAIFFDDYANTLVVGNTMRPMTDRMLISREKLAYIVDSTAAPIAWLALVTTWIGYEVGLVQNAVNQIDGYDESGYWIFLQSIPYSFYPLLALMFVLLVILTGRDFGPMQAAEQRAGSKGEVAPPGSPEQTGQAENLMIRPEDEIPHRAFNAVLPVLVLVITVIAGLWVTGNAAAEGAQPGLREIIGGADSYRALLWGSLLGVLAALALTLGQRILSMDETVQAWYRGARSMLMAMIVLVLAWSLGAVTEALGTAAYLVSLLGERLDVALLPALVFVLAAATAFATGSSWGTMAILMPQVVPLGWAMLNAQGMTGPEHFYLIHAAVAAVLSGAVWGDHCSPISDTTILSSMATQCDHVEHVRTQLPYALAVGLVALLLCLIPVGYGMPWWLGMLLALVVLAALLRLFGRPPENQKPEYGH